MASGLFLATIIDILDATELAVNFDVDTHRIALYSSTLGLAQANYAGNGATAYGVAPLNANEVTGTNWAAGGVLLPGTTLTDHNGTTPNVGVLMFDATDISVASATFTGARYGVIYADAAAGNNALVGVDFGADYSPNNGTFQIQWASTGIFSLDLVP